VTSEITPFTATTLTWTQAQSLSYGSTTTTFSSGTTNGVTVSIPVTIDVDAMIKNTSASYGWRISDDNTSLSDTTAFNTLNATSNIPQLVISYEK